MGIREALYEFICKCFLENSKRIVIKFSYPIAMAFKQRFKFDIPAGEKIYEPDFEIAGAHHYTSDIASVMSKQGTSFYLKPEPQNKFDSNAIAVVGQTKNWLGTKIRKVGYLPSEIAKRVVETKMFEHVMLRPKSLYISDDGYVEFIADLLGPKPLWSQYNSARE